MAELRDRFYGALVFTDIEGSSALWEAYPRSLVRALDEHNRIIRDACVRHNGRVIKEEGDAFFLALPSAEEAVQFALEAQSELLGHDWSEYGPADLKVRMGLHFGTAWRRGDDLIGAEVNRAARIAGAGHGGQVLASGDFIAEYREVDSDTVVVDLGRCRLRGLASPEHLYQITRIDWGRQEWPALRTLDHVPTNLPARVTSFVGREDELVDLSQLLSDDTTRLVTLTGPGGSGKSRLAQEAAGRALDQFPDGVYWLELADVSDPASVMAALTKVLKIEPAAGRSAVDQIVEFTRDRQVLLVLDNLEHVMDAADSLGLLLRSTAGMKLLVTSREVLRLPGEHVYDIRPLSIPEPPINWETLSQYESVQLFLQRAREVRSDFVISPDNAAAVAEICTRLDGIPLALELAAAWVRMYEPEQILDQLGPQARVLTSRVRGVAERQRTLYNAIEWSYNLLGEEDRRVFRFLSVFHGGFFLDAAEAVCGPEGLAGVEALHDCSLLYTREVLGRQRFFMLGTLRDFAAGKLAETDEAIQVRSAHLDFYVRYAREVTDPPPEEMEHRKGLAAIELHNLLHALDTAITLERTDAVAPLCEALHDEDIVDPGRAAEIRHQILRIWKTALNYEDIEAAARLGHLAVHVHWKAWDHIAAIHLADEAMELAVATGDRELCWDVAVTAAAAAAGGRREDEIRKWLEIASPYARDAEAHSLLIMFIAGLGRHAEAAEAAEELLRSLSPDESPEGKHLAYHAAAVVRMRMAEFEEAARAGEVALQIIREHFSNDREMSTAAPPIYLPAFARSGRRHLAETVVEDVIRRLQDAPPALITEKASGLVAFCNLAEMWETSAAIADDFLRPFPPTGLPEGPLPDVAGNVAEAYARIGRTDDARATIALLVSSNRVWDDEMGYFTGQNIKAVAEVLRASGKLTEAVTTAELARRLQEPQPALQLTCAELLDLLAQELPEDEYREAIAAAEQMKPSEAIALCREVLGV